MKTIIKKFKINSSSGIRKAQGFTQALFATTVSIEIEFENTAGGLGVAVSFD